MTEQEYIDFSDHRSVTFLNDGKDKFLNFIGEFYITKRLMYIIDLNKRHIEFIEKNKQFVEFLGYLLCKAIGNIIERIIRDRTDGQLKMITIPITREEIKIEAEKYINIIKVRLRKVLKDAMVYYIL